MKRIRHSFCPVIMLFSGMMVSIIVFLAVPVKADTRIELEKQELFKLKEKINEQIDKLQKKQFRKLTYMREFSEIEFAIALKRKNSKADSQ